MWNSIGHCSGDSDIDDITTLNLKFRLLKIQKKSKNSVINVNILRNTSEINIEIMYT